MAANIALTEFGTGNPDLQSETYYFLLPTVASETTVATNFFTGASKLPILFTASPTPTPTGTPTPTPTVSPTPTPTPTPSPTPTGTPTPTPTPVTPAAVLGISPGKCLRSWNTRQRRSDRQDSSRFDQSFMILPIELSGVSVTINGVGCGLKSVNGRRVEFAVSPAIASATTGTVLPIVINNNGTLMKAG